MNFYPHHIGDFNNSTRHLTRVERSVYRDAIELYYDTETALTADLDKLYRKLLCASDEEKAALKAVLDEFFLKTERGYTHERCDIEIEKYRLNTSAKARAGIASAAKRKQKSTHVEQKSTPVHNQEPITNNQEPIKRSPRIFSDEDADDARAMFSAIQTLNPKHKPPDFDKWAEEIRLIRERDRRTRDEIIALFRWANADPFWQTNILSPAKLREKWDVLTMQTKRKDNAKTQQDTRSRAQRHSDKLDEIARASIERAGRALGSGDFQTDASPVYAQVGECDGGD